MDRLIELLLRQERQSFAQPREAKVENGDFVEQDQSRVVPADRPLFEVRNREDAKTVGVDVTEEDNVGQQNTEDNDVRTPDGEGNDAKRHALAVEDIDEHQTPPMPGVAVVPVITSDNTEGPKKLGLLRPLSDYFIAVSRTINAYARHRI